MQRTDQSIDAPHFSRTRVIRRSPAFCAFAAFLIAVTFGVSATFAAEDWSAFLDALKSRGYDDVAHVYLKQLQESGQAPPELDAELDYRVGAAAFDEAIATTGTRRTQLLGEANAAFEKYLGSNPDGTFALEANAGQARIAAERGDSLMSEARRNGVAESSRDEKLALARVEYAAAKKSFAAAIKLSQARVKNAQGEGARVEELRAAQAVFLDLTIRYATTLAQIARTYPEGSDEYKKGLTDAGERFGKIYSTYQRYAGAYKARLSEAQIDHELGDDDAALDMYELIPETLAAYGIWRYEISNYARIGSECRHNVSVWRGGLLRGFGPAAAGFDGCDRMTEVQSLDEWLAGAPPELDRIPRDRRLAEIFAVNLRTVDGWTPELWQGVPGADSWEARSAVVAQVMHDLPGSWWKITPKCIKLSDEGLCFWNDIAEAMLT